MTSHHGRAARSAVHLLFLMSGAAGLVYQIVWMRTLILVFGATALAVSTVLTAFMAGLALGSWGFGRYVDRVRRPLRLYGILEIGIGLYALAVPFLFESLVPVYRWIWNSFEPGLMTFSLMKFPGSLLLLLIPTTLMGGTLPILARWATARESVIGARVGTLYAINTAGAVLGTFLCGFVFIRFLGTNGTIGLAATTNILLGLASLWISHREESSAAGVETPEPETSPEAAGGWSFRLTPLLLVYALSGFAALLLEVAWTRTLTLIIGGSTYAFTIMLTSFLVGLAGGAAVFAHVVDRVQQRRGALLAGLLVAAGLAALGSTWLFGEMQYFYAVMFRDITNAPLASTALKFLTAALVMFPATFLLGGIFPVVVRMHSGDVSRLGRSVGEVYAANTAGTIIGAFAGGFVFIPLLGIQGTLTAVAVLEITLGCLVLVLMAGGRTAVRWSAAVGVALLAGALVMARPAWNSLLMNSGLYLYVTTLPEEFDRAFFDDWVSGGYTELFYREGATASILVAEEDDADSIFLSVNGKVDASSGDDMETQVLSAHLPLLFHREPKTVALVGLASGVTAGSVLTHAGVQRMDVIEIEEAVVQASRFFDDVNNRPLDSPRTNMIVNDGRNFLLFTDRKYDIIISEPSNPWMTGASNLFTREYFQLLDRRMGSDGISCQWIQGYDMKLPDLKILLRTYGSVFRHVLLFSLGGSDLLLLGSQSPMLFDLEALRERMSLMDIALDLGRVGIRQPEDVLARFALGETELAAFVGKGPLNTDANAHVEFSAPWSLFTRTVKENKRAMRAHQSALETYLTRPPASEGERADFLSRVAYAMFRAGLYEQARDTVRRSLEIAPGGDAARRLEEALAERLDG